MSESSLFHEGFLSRAHANPAAVAIRDRNVRFTYDELLQKALQLGNAIHNRAGPSVRPVAIIGDKSHLAIEAIVAVTLTGRPYCFLNPSQRRPRLQRMIETLRPSLIIDIGSTEGDHAPEALARDTTLLRFPMELSQASFDPIKSPTGAAYVLFTSGSTGEPKGVAVGHGAAIAAQRAFLQEIKLTEKDVVAGEAPLNFDVSVFDIFATLSAGATLALIPDDEINPLAVLALLEDSAVTSIFTVPSLVQQMLECAPDASKRFARIPKVMMTGELLSARLADLMAGQIRSGCSFWNLYGATEFPWGLSRRISLQDISQPNVLEKANSFAPIVANIEETGELFVRGAGLSSGYIEPNTDYFMPFAPLSSFATGDFAEEIDHDCYHLLGRRDRQIRRDGYRIELREVENWIETHPVVDCCFATYQPEKRELSAYVCLRSGSPDLVSDGSLTTYARSVLPQYMLPDRFILLEAVPHTMSGKKDYSNLRPPE